jgi:hypothetical protein
MPADKPGRVDVFDQQGMRLGFIELPLRSKVIGFGAHSDAGVTVYVTRTDELGLVWLERYRVSPI